MDPDLNKLEEKVKQISNNLFNDRNDYELLRSTAFTQSNNQKFINSYSKKTRKAIIFHGFGGENKPDILEKLAIYKKDYYETLYGVNFKSFENVFLEIPSYETENIFNIKYAQWLHNPFVDHTRDVINEMMR